MASPLTSVYWHMPRLPGARPPRIRGLSERAPPSEEMPASAVDQLTGLRLRRRRVPPLRPRRIVVALEPRHPSDDALAWGVELGASFRARVAVVSVVRGGPIVAHEAKGPSQIVDEEQAADRLLVDAAGRLHGASVANEIHLLRGVPASQIVRFVRGFRADLVIVGSHDYGPVGRAILGSVADAVKDRSPASVLIVRGSARVQRILAALDGSTPSRRAAGFALRLMRRTRGRVTILHVATGRRPVSPETRLGAWARPGVKIQIRHGRAARAILAEARQQGSDLLVAGCRGLSGVRRLVAGSVSDALAHRAKCSVLLAK